ncbi:hypothetical protein GCM10022261_20340 [Brevibacterium daeguense]|uniref:Uncharacterized protein n=1 Tax=Brevibacterium daeguense TaxID=909936 RepID=A0ABP8EKN0_9MICO|nr:hypothetical protein [Brevibacterium daeguense]
MTQDNRRSISEASEHDIADSQISTEEQEATTPETPLNVSQAEASESDLVDQAVTVPLEDDDR